MYLPLKAAAEHTLVASSTADVLVLPASLGLIQAD